MSTTIVRDECSIELRAIDFSTGIVGPLLDTQLFELADVVGDAPNVPNEIALVLTYGTQEQSGTTASRARRRGRIYLGPLNADAVTAQNNVAAVPNSNFISAVYTAAARLGEYSYSLGDNGGTEQEGQWVMFSRTGAAYGVVGGGWVDNAWDSQRRRGTEATARQTWTLLNVSGGVP
jgi:hypothetical protein